MEPAAQFKMQKRQSHRLLPPCYKNAASQSKRRRVYFFCFLEGIFHAHQEIAARLRIPAVPARIAHVVAHIRIHPVEQVIQAQKYVQAFHRPVVDAQIAVGMLRFSQHPPKDRKSLHGYIKVSLNDIPVIRSRGKSTSLRREGENEKEIDKKYKPRTAGKSGSGLNGRGRKRLSFLFRVVFDDFNFRVLIEIDDLFLGHADKRLG